MTSIPKPEALLFDMGGTLLRSVRWDPEEGNRSVLALSNNPRGITADDVAEAIRALDDDLHARRESSWMEVSPWAVQRLVYERLGIEFDLTPWEVEAAFLRVARSWIPEPGVVRTLATMSDLGLPLAVLSNSAFSGSGLTAQLEEHGLARFFRFVMSSADYVVRKPHPAFFHTAAGRLGVEPEAVWYVGDMPQYDVVGARAAGMISILYAPSDGTPADPQPHATVADWASFSDLVAASL